MACEYCEIIEGKRPAAKVYEDDKVVCILAEKPAAAGHVIVIPKIHKPIFEMLPDDIAAHAFWIANKVSIALFESVKAQGTNIITQNGLPAGQEIPHFSINVIARRQGDGLLFEWLPKKLSQEDMAKVEMQVKQELEKTETTNTMRPATTTEKDQIKGKDSEKQENKEKKEEQEEKDKEESYLIRQLRRMP